MLQICQYRLRKNIGAPHSPDTVQNTNYITVSMFRVSTLRNYQLCHIFYIPGLLQTNQADITSLASRLPLFSRYYLDQSQLSQALLFIQSGWLLSCCVECRSPSIIQLISCFQKQIWFVTINRSCSLYYSKLFRIFIAAISYVLAPNAVLHCKWIPKFVTVLIRPTDHRHPQSAHIILFTA